MNRGSSLDGHINPTAGGPLRVNDGEGFADGNILTTTGKICDATTRGARHFIPGNAGVADRWVVCEKSAADTYAWVEKGQAAIGGAYQPLDSDLTTIAGLTATTDNMIQSVASAWASRTPAQVKTALAITTADMAGELLIAQDSNYTGADSNAAQKVFDESTNGAATVAASTSYLMEGIYHIHTTGTTSGVFNTLFGGAATLTSIGYAVDLIYAATEVQSATFVGGWVTSAAAYAVTGAIATARHFTITIKGIVRVNGGGTFIPQYQFSVAPGAAPVTLANSYFRLTPFGSNTAVTVGTWT
jgi:hypothetical protein